MSPFQAREATEIVIGANPFTTVFDCHCRQKCVCEQISFGAGSLTKLSEDLPVMRSGRDTNSIGLIANLGSEFTGIRQCARHLEYARMSDDT